MYILENNSIILLFSGLVISFGFMVEEAVPDKFIDNVSKNGKPCSKARTSLVLEWMLLGFLLTMCYKSGISFRSVASSHVRAFSTWLRSYLNFECTRYCVPLLGVRLMSVLRLKISYILHTYTLSFYQQRQHAGL